MMTLLFNNEFKHFVRLYTAKIQSAPIEEEEKVEDKDKEPATDDLFIPDILSVQVDTCDQSELSFEDEYHMIEDDKEEGKEGKEDEKVNLFIDFINWRNVIIDPNWFLSCKNEKPKQG